MHLEVLVEEASAEAALRALLPKLLGDGVTFEIYPHQGKRDLLAKLPRRLRAYRRWIPADWSIVVLIDEDREDCHALKDELERAARGAGFPTRSSPAEDGRFAVLNRVAVEELEAWFFGDPGAIASAFPRVPRTLGERAAFRDPDAIKGGTWEALARTLRQAGYFQAGMPKIEVARSIAAHMEPHANSSRSFHTFRKGLEALVR